MLIEQSCLPLGLWAHDPHFSASVVSCVAGWGPPWTMRHGRHGRSGHHEQGVLCQVSRSTTATSQNTKSLLRSSELRTQTKRCRYAVLVCSVTDLAAGFQDFIIYFRIKTFGINISLNSHKLRTDMCRSSVVLMFTIVKYWIRKTFPFINLSCLHTIPVCMEIALVLPTSDPADPAPAPAPPPPRTSTDARAP